MALGLGLAAFQHGMSVGFGTAAALVHELMEARDERRLLNLQGQLSRLNLLIIDELGFVPLSRTGAELLFEVFSQRYEMGFTLVTTNLPSTRGPGSSARNALPARCWTGSPITSTSWQSAAQQGWELAYALGWLSVSGSNSVMPPWVRHRFPGAGRLVRQLRDRPCGDGGCDWCRERHDARSELARWFGFDDFRPEPAGDDGRPLQLAIVESAMAGEHALGILPGLRRVRGLGLRGSGSSIT